MRSKDPDREVLESRLAAQAALPVLATLNLIVIYAALNWE